MPSPNYQYFEEIRGSGTPAESRVNNTVGRSISPRNRSLSSIVGQSGKPITDADFNALQDVMRTNMRSNLPSHWQTLPQFEFEDPGEFNDSTPLNDAKDGSDLINCFLLPKAQVLVDGHLLTIEHTWTTTSNYNIIKLDGPTTYIGNDETAKRADFVWLECWRALVAPGTRAFGFITIVDNNDNVTGDIVTIDGDSLVADTDYAVGADAAETALNLTNAVNSTLTTVYAKAYGTRVGLFATEIGTVGNGYGLLTTSAGQSVSGATLLGGEDVPNKPETAQGYLFVHGNVNSPASEALPHEMVDSIYANVETSQRIQMQYRIRSTSGIDFKAHPDGFSSALVLAQGSRSSDVATYTFSPDSEDVGLWISGDGTDTSAMDLGTIDGYVYAVPVAVVFRRSEGPFDPVDSISSGPLHDHTSYTGTSGATIGIGLSDRPDGLFSDIIVRTDVLDLRRSLPSLRDLRSELDFQFQSLMDGTLQTWAMDVADKQIAGNSSGSMGTTYLVCDEIGRSNEGVAPYSGPTTGRGVLIRDFDHIARRFSTAPIVERVVFAFYPDSANSGRYVTKNPADLVGWYFGDSLTLDLENLDITGLGNLFQGDESGSSGAGLTDVNFSSRCPAGTVITDVLSAWHDDGHYTYEVDQNVQFSLIEGYGTQTVTLYLDSNPQSVNGGDSGNPEYQLVGDTSVGPTGSPRRIFVEFEITYPEGRETGLTNYPVEVQPTPDGTVYDGVLLGPGAQIELDVANRPVDFSALMAPKFRPGTYEVCMEYATSNVALVGDTPDPSTPVSDTLVSRNRTTLYTPRRLSASPTVTDSISSTVKTVDTAAVGSSSREVVLTTQLSGTGHTLCAVEYFPQDPIPNFGPSGAGYQIGVYYQADAPQTAGSRSGSLDTFGTGSLPSTLSLDILAVSDKVYSIQTGMGTTELGFPYLQPGKDIPHRAPVDDTYLSASSNMTVGSLSVGTGLVIVNPYVPVDSQGPLILGGELMGTRPEVDSELRVSYATPVTTSYLPTVLGHPLTGTSAHKVALPMLCRVSETVFAANDSLIVREGDVVLVVLTNLPEVTSDNSIIYDVTGNTSCVAVYLTRNRRILNAS